MFEDFLIIPKVDSVTEFAKHPSTFILALAEIENIF